MSLPQTTQLMDYTDPAVASFMRLASNTTADVVRLLRMALVPSVACVVTTKTGVPQELGSVITQIACNGAEAALNAAQTAHQNCTHYQQADSSHEIVARLYSSGRTVPDQRSHVINYAAAEVQREIEEFCTQGDDNNLAQAFNYAAWQQTVLRTWLMKGLQQTVDRSAAKNPLPRNKTYQGAQQALHAAFRKIDSTVLSPLITFQNNLYSAFTQAAQDHLRDFFTDVRSQMLEAHRPDRSWLAGDILTAHRLYEPLNTATTHGLPLSANYDSKLVGELLMVLEGAHLSLTRGAWQTAIFTRYQKERHTDLNLTTPDVRDALTGACTIMGKRLTTVTEALRTKITDMNPTAPGHETPHIGLLSQSFYAH